MAGARPAAPIAAAWAILRHLGEDGYAALARQIRDTVEKFQAGIAAIPGMRVIGEPVMSVFSFTSDDADIFAIGDAMDDKGWCLDRQKNPDALHVMLSPKHATVADVFLEDLAEAAKHHGPSRGREARYS